MTTRSRKQCSSDQNTTHDVSELCWLRFCTGCSMLSFMKLPSMAQTSVSMFILGLLCSFISFMYGCVLSAEFYTLNGA